MGPTRVERWLKTRPNRCDPTGAGNELIGSCKMVLRPVVESISNLAGMLAVQQRRRPCRRRLADWLRSRGVELTPLAPANPWQTARRIVPPAAPRVPQRRRLRKPCQRQGLRRRMRRIRRAESTDRCPPFKVGRRHIMTLISRTNIRGTRQSSDGRAKSLVDQPNRFTIERSASPIGAQNRFE